MTLSEERELLLRIKADRKEFGTLHLNKTQMKFKWFIRKGIFFLPASIPGWLIFVAAAAYAVYLFIDIDSRSHSVSDTLINWVFNCLIVGVIYSLIGFFTERKQPDA